MNFFEKITYFLDAKMEEPQVFGVFHIISFILVVILTAFLIYKFKDAEDKTFRKIVFFFWVAIIIFEVYKQINFAFSYNDGDPVWDYAWYSFPYQFCSTPHYVLPFVVFLKDGRVRDACMSFITYGSLIGGIAVFAFPGDVFIETVGINIQTMFHHGMQIVFGIYFAVYNRRKFGLKYLLSSFPVFLVLTAVAMILNVTVYHGLRGAGMDDTFNMFFISPYFPSTLPVLSGIYDAVPYPVFLLLYIVAVILGGFVIYGVEMGIRALVLRKKADAKI